MKNHYPTFPGKVHQGIPGRGIGQPDEAGTRPLDIAATARAGMQALADGRVADAKASFLQIRQVRPDNPAWRTGLAHVALSDRDPAEALRLLDEASQVSPSLKAAWTSLRARALGMMGRWDEAECAFRQALDLSPDKVGLRLELATTLAHVVKALTQPHNTAAKAGRVFVIGLSKTGTTTLDAALTRLGFAAQHTHNPLTRQQLQMEDAELFDALGDIPIADIFESLAERFPQARFILTRRPGEDWLRSITAHFRRILATDGFAALKERVADPDACPGGVRWRQILENIYTRHADFPTAYMAHEARVRQFFQSQPGRLLEFDVFSGDGWPQLCGFLGLPVPEGPFPWKNASPLRQF